MEALNAEGRAPRVIVLENVYGTLTSHGGKDFSAIASAFAEEDYRFGAFVIDAALFVPQSRPRLFVVGVRNDVDFPDEFVSAGASSLWHPQSLCLVHERLDKSVRKNWRWWKLPKPSKRKACFADLIEEHPADVKWHTEAETKRLLSMMSDINLQKVQAAKETGRLTIGAIYKRTRFHEGKKVQRAEVRFDDIAGCLRTPAGGSSRQLILAVQGQKVRSRLISARETARLMGLPDTYKLPNNYNEAYHLTGDGVVVPVVRYLAENLLEPLLEDSVFEERIAA